jgi:aspartate 4-decarboxylase
MQARALSAYERMSPFEIKDELIRLAADRRGARLLLDAGRGNPNWLATAPRDAFFVLGQFSMAESRRSMDQPSGLGGLPQAGGIAARCDAWLAQHAEAPGAGFLQAAIALAVAQFGFRADAFVHELVDAIAGGHYPMPVRMLPHAETIVEAYLRQVVCGGATLPGRFRLFATEGATAGICYLLRSLRANRILVPGDAIALGCPVFTPYLELTGLAEYGLHVTHVQARAEDRFQFADAELAKLEDPRIKAFFLVNPGNPTSVALEARVLERIVAILRGPRPDLLVVTDDVYATFVEGFRSLLAEAPHNTVGLYSFSKYFGCTGWRLGVVALQEDNILDAMLAARPDAVAEAQDARYAALSPEPRRLAFLDRMAADSRDVGLNHTAGLSPPQQAMMTLFALSELMDEVGDYREACRAILRRRSGALLHALGIHGEPNPLFDHYYGLIDLGYWLRTHLGEEVAAWVTRNVHPLDLVFRLAERHGIVLLNGGGFHAPGWSARVSFANLPDAAYEEIGRAIRAIAEEYARAAAADPAKAGDRE